jgi:hypothetical protein
MKDFKKLLIQHKDIIYHYFNYLPIKSRNSQKEEIEKKNQRLKENQNQNLINSNINNINPYISSLTLIKKRESLNINTNPNIINNFNQQNISKAEFINNFNKNYYNFINKSNTKLDFYISFGSNVIQSISLCEICNKPNTIWDIRREFQFSKNRRESKTKCKYCNMLYVPYFLIIDDFSENNNNYLGDKKEKKKISIQINPLQNFNSISYRNSNNNVNLNNNLNTNIIINDNKTFDEENKINKSIESVLKENYEIPNLIKNNNNVNNNNNNYLGNTIQENLNQLQNDYRIKKVEYMCFEHLLYMFIENEINLNQEKDFSLLNNRNKKFICNSNFMTNLLKGEIKLRIENNNFSYFTIDDYIKKLFFNKYANENASYKDNNNNNNNFNTIDYQINNFEGGLKKNQMKSNLTLARLLKEVIDRKKIEEEEKKERHLKKIEYLKEKELKNKGNKIVNIKFDLKDLIIEEKYKNFDKEIEGLNEIRYNNKNNKKNKENLLGTISKIKNFFLYFLISYFNFYLENSKSNSANKKINDKNNNNIIKGKFNNQISERLIKNSKNSQKNNFVSSLAINMIDKNKKNNKDNFNDKEKIDNYSKKNYEKIYKKNEKFEKKNFINDKIKIEKYGNEDDEHENENKKKYIEELFKNDLFLGNKENNNNNINKINNKNHEYNNIQLHNISSGNSQNSLLNKEQNNQKYFNNSSKILQDSDFVSDKNKSENMNIAIENNNNNNDFNNSKNNRNSNYIHKDEKIFALFNNINNNNNNEIGYLDLKKFNSDYNNNFNIPNNNKKSGIFNSLNNDDIINDKKINDKLIIKGNVPLENKKKNIVNNINNNNNLPSKRNIKKIDNNFLNTIDSLLKK